MQAPGVGQSDGPNPANPGKAAKSAKRSRSPIVKTKFSADEDAKLQQIVQEFGTDDWVLVAFLHGTRNPRQCRERYQNYLAPSLRADPWTAQEDALLLEKCAQYGTKWNKIAEFFTDRSDNSLRNRWLMLERRKARQWKSAGLTPPPFPFRRVPPSPPAPRPLAPPLPLSDLPIPLKPVSGQPGAIELAWPEKNPEESLQSKLELAERVDSECNIFRQDQPDIWSSISKF
jgi:hypothetical protein